MNVSRKHVLMAMEAIVEPISLNEPLYHDSNDTIYVMDQIGDKTNDHSWLNEILIRTAIANLTKREKNILALRFLTGKTQIETAKEIGISQAQVSRLEKTALKTIKSKIKDT